MEKAPTEKGKEAARGLEQEARNEVHEVETEKGLARGADRVDERSRSSDGKDAGSKPR